MTLNDFFLEWKMFQTKAENQNIHFIFNYFNDNCTIYKIIWKNKVKPVGPQITGVHVLCMLDN